jgi:hypothetical protein
VAGEVELKAVDKSAVSVVQALVALLLLQLVEVEQVVQDT